ncbi:MAG: hypothetical protein ACRC5C_03375 [Bacilli bacterium]
MINETHRLYIEPALTAEEAFERFGWARTNLMNAESNYAGYWTHWLKCIEEEHFKTPENLSFYQARQPNIEFRKQLQKEMDAIRTHGYYADAFLQWIAFAIGISYVKKNPLPYELHERLYNNLDLEDFWRYSADYFSLLLAMNGQNGVADYFPTPSGLSQLLSELTTGMMTDMDKAKMSVYEPFLGAGSIMLSTPTWNFYGTELCHAPALASAIQAFFYKPSALYCPSALIGMHLCVNGFESYFEYDTDTRIYIGDTVFGEYRAPKNIFEENSEWVDVYLYAKDLSKNEMFKYIGVDYENWLLIDPMLRFDIIKAYARTIKPDSFITNPPFSPKFTSTQKEKMDRIENENRMFVRTMESRLLVDNFYTQNILELASPYLSRNRQLEKQIG